VTAAPNRRQDRSRAPTTPGQRRDWQVHHGVDASSFQHLSAAFQTTDAAPEPALAAAVDQLVARHEVLRTRFGTDRDRLVQIIEEPGWDGSPRLTFGETETGAIVDSRLAAVVRGPFDLTSEAPCRFALLAGADDRTTFVVSIHHIVSDQLSVGVILRDLSELVAAAIFGRPSTLPELPVQFPDYAVWWDHRRATGQFDANLRFWREELDGAPLHETVPVRRKGSLPAVTDSVDVPQHAADRLASAASRLRTTPYVVLLTAFSAALMELTGVDDAVVGCGYANRNCASFLTSVGRFSSNMALRIRAKPDCDLPSRARIVHERAVHAYANAVVSLDAAREEGLTPGGADAEPLPDVAFQLVSGVGNDLRWPGVSFEPVNVSTGRTKQPLNVVAENVDGTLTLHTVYSPEAIAAGWVEVLSARCLENLDRLLVPDR